MKLKELVFILLLGVFSNNSLYTQYKYDETYDKMSYKEAIKKVTTPIEAKDYCLNHLKSSHNSLDYEGYYHNFEDIHKNKRVDCVHAAISCAALLSDDGFKPYILSFGEEGKTGHTVFLYQKGKKYGSIGINEQDFTKPVFSTEKALASYLFLKIYNRFPKDDLYWEVKDLDKLGNFIDGKIVEYEGIKFLGIGERYPEEIDSIDISSQELPPFVVLKRK